MTLKQAIKIVESHNRWRRDNNVPPKTKMASPTELGKALDVLLIVAKDCCKIHDMDRVDIKPKNNMKRKRECPKCKSRFGVVLSKNICKENSEIICFNASCDFKMNIVEWNKKYKDNMDKVDIKPLKK